MYATTYHKPATVDGAAAAMAGAEEGKYLGGGMTLLPTMKQHLAAPSDLVDLRGSGLSGITISGTSVTIGATTTHAEVASHAELARVCPAISKLAGGIGDPAVRAMGTIGGSIANNDPAADYPSAILALGASVITNQREIAADDFFQGMFSTALEDDEIITAVRFKAPMKAAYAKFPNPASRYAMAGVFVAQTSAGVRVAVTGAGSDGVFRHAGLEAALGGGFAGSSLDSVEVSEDGLLSDIHGSAAYRANLVKVMAQRAVESAS